MSFCIPRAVSLEYLTAVFPSRLSDTGKVLLRTPVAFRATSFQAVPSCTPPAAAPSTAIEDRNTW